jgi:hypothetical protein
MNSTGKSVIAQKTAIQITVITLRKKEKKPVFMHWGTELGTRHQGEDSNPKEERKVLYSILCRNNIML